MKGSERGSTIALVLLLTAAAPVAGAGDLLVGSYISNQVLRYDAETGALLDVFVAAGSGGLSLPGSMAIGPDGNLYVASSGSSQVLRYDGETGAFLGAFVSAGSGGLDGPSGLLFTGDKLLVGSLNPHQVLSYNASTGAFAGVFISAGSGGMTGASTLVKGPDNNVYVVSDGTNSVRRYHGQTGAFLGVFASTGSTDNGGLSGMAFGPDGHLYVASFRTDRVLRFNGQTGALLGEFVGAAGGLNGPGPIAFGPDGDLYAGSLLFNPTRVLRYDGHTGAFLGTFIAASGNHGDLTGPTALLFRAGSSGPCVRDERTACLLDGRFEVKVTMKDFASPPVTFPGVIQTYQGASSETDQSASFYSFQFGNVEIFVKMVDACTAPSHAFWLFAAGATTADTEILVRDTVAEETYRIHNPAHVQFETVADTLAFLTCDQ